MTTMPLWPSVSHSDPSKRTCERSCTSGMRHCRSATVIASEGSGLGSPCARHRCRLMTALSRTCTYNFMIREGRLRWGRGLGDHPCEGPTPGRASWVAPAGPARGYIGKGAVVPLPCTDTCMSHLPQVCRLDVRTTSVLPSEVHTITRNVHTELWV